MQGVGRTPQTHVAHLVANSQWPLRWPHADRGRAQGNRTACLLWSGWTGIGNPPPAAVGLAAAATAVSLLDGFGQRPLLVRDAGALVQIRSLDRDSRPGRMSYPDYEDLRDQAAARFRELAAYGTRGAGLSGPPEAAPQVVLLTVASPNYFTALGVSARIGRTFMPQDAAAAPGQAGVISR